MGADVTIKTQLQLAGDYKTLVLRDAPAGYWRLGDSEGYAQAVLSDAPVGFWRLSGNANDSASSPHNGTAQSGVTFGQTGPLSDGSTAAAFDGGSNAYIDMGNVAALAFTGAFSAEAWVKFSASTLGAICSKSRGSDGMGWALVATATGAIRFWAYTSAPAMIFDFSTNETWGDGNWHHVVATWSGTTSALGVKIYVDGVVVRQVTANAGTPDNTNTFPFRIGALSDGTQWSGTIGATAAYSYALSAQQIANHYALRTSTITTVAAATAADSSGNGLTGTYAGGATLRQAAPLADGNAAALFDGATGKVTLPSTAFTAAMSVEAWMKTSGNALMPIWSNRAFTLGSQVYVGNNGGKFFAYLNEATTPALTGATTVNDGQWHHVVWTNDGTTSKLYVDGVLDATQAQTHGTRTALSQIGYDTSNNDYWNGSLDEVAVHNYALTAQQIASRYALRTSTIATVAKATAADTSGNALTGTYNSGVTLQRTTLQPDGDRAALFDGTGWVSVPSDSKISLGAASQSFSVELWVEGALAGNVVDLLEKGSGPFNGGGIGISIRTRLDGANIEFTRGDGTAGTPPRLTLVGVNIANKRTHIAVTYDAATGLASGYVNGAFVASATMRTGAYTDTYALLLARGVDGFAVATLDEVAVYTSKLTASQVLNHYLAGAWTDVSADVVAEEGVRWKRGMTSNAPGDCVAGTGTLEFSLRNDELNSGATAGWYSPASAACRPGFTFGIPVRLVANDGTDRPQWRGRLRTILPDPGIYGTRRTHCTAQDCVGDLAETDVRSIAPQINKTEVQLLTALIAALPAESQPPATSFDAALDTYPYAFDDIGGGTTAMDAAKRVVASAQGLLYAKADGTLRYDNRHTAALKTSSFTFTDALLKRDDGLSVPSSLANVFNRVRVTIHPKTVDLASVVVLYAAASRVAVSPGETIEVWGSYTDPTNRTRVLGGTNFQTPLVSGTDYSGNTAADGTGADVTASVSVTATCFAADVKFTITNTGALLAYVQYQVRGTAIYDNAPRTFESFTAESYGDRPLDLDLPYQADANIAKDLADYYKSQYLSLTGQLDAEQFFPLASATLMTQALTREIGDVITITEPQIGVANATAVILGIEIIASAGAEMLCRYLIGPRTVGSFLIFDDAVYGVFDAATSRFGYA